MSDRIRHIFMSVSHAFWRDGYFIKRTEYAILIVLLFVLNNTYSQNIIIDPKNSPGPVPTIYEPGIFLVPKTADGTTDFLNNGIRHNSIRMISIEVAMEFSSPSIAGVMAQLEAAKPGILYANSRCDKLILPFIKMPLWLSSSTDNTISGDPNWKKFNAMPPANYATWNLLIDSIVSKINGQWGLDPYYEIWNEPDNFYWQGTPAQYFDFFNKTYFAIKTNHPTAKVGGPVLASFTSKFGSAYPIGFITNSQLDSSIIGRLIDSCMVWNAPLDFISWHKFDSFLHSMKMEIDFLNQKLINSGHGLVPYIISEWNNAFNIRESNFAAAFMPNYVLGLEKYGIAAQLVASWQDFNMDTAEFHHDYGLLSWGALHKPEWKSLLLLDKVKGEKIESDSSDYLNLAVVSSVQNDTVRVLLSNRSLPAFTEATSYLLYNKHFNVTDISTAGYTNSRLDSIYKGYITLTGMDAMSLAINSAIPIYQKADSVFRFGRNINLTISGVTGNHLGTKYLVDSTHNNVIYRFDSLLAKGYDRSSATSFLYPNSVVYGDKINLVDSSYSIHLQPNAVMLLEFYIPEISGISGNYLIQNRFEIFPNPSSENLTIKCTTHPSGSEQMLIYNSIGALVKSADIKQKISTVNIEDLSKGIYFIHLKNYPQQTLKFIKN
ncbi:MAG: T9SS type A sorting domain-containing protein [Bacteroidetes bacterium]|nr:T9SS type A sorting domain-containing protein [Bacteroidota bacterium]